MRILISEDDMTSRKVIIKLLSEYGECDMTVDGMEAVEAFLLAWDEMKPYSLICLDVMMPKLDGMKTLKAIRELENEKGIKEEEKAKIVMITALNDRDNVFEAFNSGCEAYATKPIDMKKLQEVLGKLGVDKRQ